MLLANSEGRGFLTDSKLLKEIALNLEALDPVTPNCISSDSSGPEIKMKYSSQNRHLKTP